MLLDALGSHPHRSFLSSNKTQYREEIPSPCTSSKCSDPYFWLSKLIGSPLRINWLAFGSRIGHLSSIGTLGHFRSSHLSSLNQSLSSISGCECKCSTVRSNLINSDIRGLTLSGSNLIPGDEETLTLINQSLAIRGTSNPSYALSVIWPCRQTHPHLNLWIRCESPHKGIRLRDL